MVALKRAGLALAFVTLIFEGCRPPAATSGAVEVAAGIDHSEWDRLLRSYVDDRGLVAYERWQESEADRKALAGYLTRLAAPARPPASSSDLAASLINAYNALTVSWVIENYPTPGIRSTAGPFATRRHQVGGKLVSLDDIEHGTLRKLVSYRVHAALVCAARSCPPLAREAYRAEVLDAQLDRAMARWLSRDDLNHFGSGGGARVSMIFRWFGEDFEASGGVREVLRRHGGEPARRALAADRAPLEYLEYDWSLNDQAP